MSNMRGKKERLQDESTDRKKEGLFAWTAKVGSKGQIVIPKEAREVFNIHTGDTVLLLGDIDQGIALISGERMQDMILKIKGKIS
jgi:AbrB family looped-hinge helix DNA binding protein